MKLRKNEKEFYRLTSEIYIELHENVCYENQRLRRHLGMLFAFAFIVASALVYVSMEYNALKQEPIAYYSSSPVIHQTVLSDVYILEQTNRHNEYNECFAGTYVHTHVYS